MKVMKGEVEFIVLFCLATKRQRVKMDNGVRKSNALERFAAFAAIKRSARSAAFYVKSTSIFFMTPLDLHTVEKLLTSRFL